jgi:hypothetical protein
MQVERSGSKLENYERCKHSAQSWQVKNWIYSILVKVSDRINAYTTRQNIYVVRSFEILFTLNLINKGNDQLQSNTNIFYSFIHFIYFFVVYLATILLDWTVSL